VRVECRREEDRGWRDPRVRGFTRRRRGRYAARDAKQPRRAWIRGGVWA